MPVGLVRLARLLLPLLALSPVSPDLEMQADSSRTDTSSILPSPGRGKSTVKQEMGPEGRLQKLLSLIPLLQFPVTKMIDTFPPSRHSSQPPAQP